MYIEVTYDSSKTCFCSAPASIPASSSTQVPTQVSSTLFQTREALIKMLYDDCESILRINEPDYELWKIAVRQKGTLLAHCPVHIIDYELCIVAVTQNGRAIAYCPPMKVDLYLCKLALQDKDDVLSEIVRICEINKTKRDVVYGLCVIAVKKNGMALQHCPEDIIDYSLCYKALAQNGAALEFCPYRFIDDEEALITLAIRKCPNVMSLVKQNHKHFTHLEDQAKMNALRLGVEYSYGCRPIKFHCVCGKRDQNIATKNWKRSIKLIKKRFILDHI